MKNIAQGLSLKKYKGNTHEQGGIMVNALGNKTKDVNKAVAEVEGGEYNYRYDSTNPMNNYIIPARKTLPEVNDMAKQADRFKGNNRIDYNTRTNLLNKSMKLNEMLRVQQEQQPMQMAAFGGRLKRYDPGGLLPLTPNNNLQYKTNEIPTLPTTAPKTTAEAANTGVKLDEKSMTSNVNDLTKLTKDPTVKLGKDLTVNKKGVKDVTSGLSSVASAFGPIGQAVGMGIQLAPYAIDLGKAMFDKTSVQDLQTQGSAMRLPNTTYAKNGGKLNVVPLPKFEDGGTPKTRTPKSFRHIGEFSDSLSEEQMKLIKNDPEQFNKDMLAWNKTKAIPTTTTPTTTPVVNPAVNPASNIPSINSVIKSNTNPLEIKLGKAIPLSFLDGSTKSNLITNPLDLNLSKLTEQDYINNPKLTKPLNVTKLPTTTPKTVSEAVNLGLKLNTQTNSTPEPIIETPKPSKEVKSLSEQLYDRGQKKQKLSEALMYGMAALPSEQIKTITPDYGRGDDAMSRMGLSTEPIRQEMMQGANKALELTRSQVGTAGQLQSRGQSIMSNLSSQLSQSQIQQQQYLNQLRGALAQREDTKANVLAQSQLTAREAKSAERAAKLDQLNNAISQTSAIGAGTMEQASKMSTIENENERFNRSQKNLLDLGNKATNLKVIQNKDGTISYDFIGSTPTQSNIKQADLSNPNPLVVKDNPVAPVTTTTPKEHVVKQGEGLNAIAAQYKIPVDKLLKLNNLKIGDTIHPNQKLKIE